MTSVCSSPSQAVGDLADGATLLISGFGDAGMPYELVDAVLDQGATELTVVSNNAGTGVRGIARLLAAGRVTKIICSFPRQADSDVFDDLYRRGLIDLELVPQGTLAERLRAGGAGIGAFYCRTGVGTTLTEDKEHRVINGQTYVLEHALRGDFALISAASADHVGNLVYHRTARNFGPVMATAATTTVAQVRSIVAAGEIDPEHVVTPGIFVDRLVEIQPCR